MGYENTVLVGRVGHSTPSTRPGQGDRLFCYVMIRGALEMGKDYDLMKKVGAGSDQFAAFFPPGGDGNTETLVDRYGEPCRIYSRQTVLSCLRSLPRSDTSSAWLAAFLSLFSDCDDAVIFFGH